MPEILRFDPSACDFPAPAVPILPALRLQALGQRQPDALAGPGVRFFARGRYALHAAYRLAGLGPGSVLLAPSYHCRTMLDGALALGAQVQCFGLTPDLQPDLAALRSLLHATPTVRALLLPHYFGFAQPAALVEQVASLCTQHGVLLIEDCCHAWDIALRQGPACTAGSGRVAVASPYKFFPCGEGGVLWGPPPAVAALALRAPRLDEELRGLKHLWERSRMPAPLPPLPSPVPAGARGSQVQQLDAGPSPHYHAADQGRQGLRLSRWIVRRTALAPLAESRRRHYQRWLQATAGRRGMRPLLAQLPGGSVPYMFPLLLAQPDPVFYQLKRAGVPIWRWDDMAVSACPVAADYRLRLLHLPCHQDISEAQMDWLLAAVTQVNA